MEPWSRALLCGVLPLWSRRPSQRGAAHDHPVLGAVMMSSPPRMRCWCYHRSRGLSARQRSFVAPVAPGGRGIRARRRSVLARMAGEKPCRHNSCRIAVLLGLVARQRHQPGLGFRRDRRLRPRSVIECRKCAIGQRPFDAALHRLMMHPEFFPDRAKTMVSPGRRAAFAHAPPGSPARCASAKCPSIVQDPYRSSPIRPHAAILPSHQSSFSQ